MKSSSNIWKLFSQVITVLFLTSAPAISQEHFTDNYPLKVGNVFTYKINGYTGPYSSSYRMKKVIEKDTIINSRRYYLIVSFYSGHSSPDTSLYRIDTLNGNLLIFDINACSPYFQEMLNDSLWSGKNDVAKRCGTGNITCTDTGQKNLWGMNRSYKKFHEYYQTGAGYATEERSYVKGFGFVYGFHEYNGPPMGSGRNDTLKGCIINGILYGDTAIVIGIVKITNKVPSSYKLYQNYPNPFNPITKINFDIPQNSIVKLTIYDILGKEVIKLVNNEFKQPGRYVVEFNGTNPASGVYFYRLETGTFVDSKKMVLVK